MALKLGFLIWSTDSLACDVKQPIRCDLNARPAYLQPEIFDGVNQTQWKLFDNVTEWGSNTGSRNGVAVDIDGVTYLWDVQGDASSDEEENSPFAKLAAFLELCKNCENCDDTGVGTLAGEYEFSYPAVPNPKYCYNVSVTGVVSYPNAQDVQFVEMSAGTYLVGAVGVVSYNTGSDTAVYRMCLSKPYTAIGFPSNYSFSAV